MKNFVKTLAFTLFLLISIVFTRSIFAQEPPPPPTGGHGSGGSLPPGGGVPAGEGIVILMVLGAGYATKKWRIKS